MEDVHPLTLLIIPLLAVLAPLLARGLGRWVRIPVVVFELVLGILVGPAVLGWAVPHAFVDTLSEFGLAMLFFVAGTEIQFSSFRGRLGKRASLGWLISLVVGIAAGFLLAPGEAAIVIGVALCSTALGTLLPILRDAGELRSPFGQAVAAVGAVGEFGPLIAISVFLGGRQPGLSTIVLAVFAVVAGLAIWLAYRLPQGAMHEFVSSTLHTSGQFAVRVVFLILCALVVLSIVLDLDMLLGAFTAGIIWRLIMRDASEADRGAVESKIEGVAFGFLVPIFFIYTGITFDLKSLIEQPVLFLLVPVVLVVLLLVRGLPSMLAAPEGSSRRDRFSLALLGATGLPIIVAVTAIGVDEGILTTTQQTVLVAGGMLSVLLFPLIGMSIRGEKVTASKTLQDDMA
ncbi:cation:proton antiporter [Microbacterium kyungheense]|uniref:Transporter (CPA2 family) n=1 Tax=Microbacterium kyungheense TaxID=1263636 RepID=A0A543FJ87_9MICO|nr:cation:proton antiporter [Microbacterium kyungheense]TQM33937.1 transporter (CPA2 family) [Microbacterium kyungheense]